MTASTDLTPPNVSGAGRRGTTGRGLALALIASLMFSACTANSGSALATTGSVVSPVAASPVTLNSGPVDASVTDALAANKNSHAQANDVEYDANSAVRITLNGASASAAGPGVAVSGSQVSITAPGTYLISGALTDGRIVVNSAEDGKVRLVLDGASISSSTGAAILFTEADEAVVVLAPSSTNVVKDGAYTVAADSDTPNAALYSMADLTIGGTGSLTVEGASYDGIASKDGLVILGGNITVQAADDGIRGKDYVIVEGGTLTVRSGGDGLKSDNEDAADRGYVAILGGSVNATATGDGLYGATDVIVGDGAIVVATNGSTAANAASSKGLKAGVSIVIGGGTLTIDAADDGIHSDGDVAIGNGTITISTGDDGVHAERALSVSGGDLTIKKSYEGLEGAQIVLSGGTISVNSTDDGINPSNGAGAATQGGGGRNLAASTSTILISGGTITVNSLSDAVDANGSITITGGTLVANGSERRDGGTFALDADTGIVIQGGTLLAAGGSGMGSAPKAGSTQGWVSVSFAQAVPAGSVIHLLDGDTVIASYLTAKNTLALVFSSPAITSGKTYDVYTGGSVNGENIGGYSANGAIAGATRMQTVTAGQHTAAGGGGRAPVR